MTFAASGCVAAGLPGSVELAVAVPCGSFGSFWVRLFLLLPGASWFANASARGAIPAIRPSRSKACPSKIETQTQRQPKKIELKIG